jgi:hypothetical protein
LKEAHLFFCSFSHVFLRWICLCHLDWLPWSSKDFDINTQPIQKSSCWSFPDVSSPDLVNIVLEYLDKIFLSKGGKKIKKGFYA